MGFVTATLSKIGGRDLQQDDCGSIVRDAAGVWVVADGLGGQQGGEVASRLAVEAALGTIDDGFDASPAGVRARLEAANAAVVGGRGEDPALARMSSTIVLLVADRGVALWGHVGDSRLYHLRGGRIVFQTRDHSVPQRMADAGEIPAPAVRYHEDRSRVLRTLGKSAELRAAVCEQPASIEPGDAFLLCSDGFWEPITEPEMEAALAEASSPKEWLAILERRLQDRVKPAHDNYTAVAVWVSAD